MKKCIAVLFSDIDNDSRAKRNFCALSKIYNCEVLAFNDSDKTYVFPVHALVKVFKNRRFNSLFLIFQTLFHLFKLNPDVVFAEGLMPLVPSSIYAFIFRKKLIYDGRELYVHDEKGNYSYSKFHSLTEKFFIKIASVTMSANEARSEIVCKAYKLNQPSVVVKNIPPLKNVKVLSLPDEFIYLARGQDFIIYQGHLKKMRDLDKFIRSMEYLPATIELIMIVQGSGINEAKKILEELNISSRVHIHGFVDHDTLYTILKHCKLGIISYELKGPNNEYCAPNKLYEYAQCNLPMVTSPQHTFEQLFQFHKIGSHVDRDAWINNDYKGIAKTILNELSKSKDPSEFERFNNMYNWKNEEAKLLQVLK